MSPRGILSKSHRLFRLHAFRLLCPNAHVLRRLELVALELDTELDVPPRLLRLDAELLEGVG